METMQRDAQGQIDDRNPNLGAVLSPEELKGAMKLAQEYEERQRQVSTPQLQSWCVRRMGRFFAPPIFINTRCCSREGVQVTYGISAPRFSPRKRIGIFPVRNKSVFIYFRTVFLGDGRLFTLSFHAPPPSPGSIWKTRLARLASLRAFIVHGPWVCLLGYLVGSTWLWRSRSATSASPTHDLFHGHTKYGGQRILSRAWTCVA